MDANILDLIRSNDHLTVSRLITHIENDKKISNSVLEEIYKYGKDALRIGVTGPPGCGKSTLTDQLIKQILNDGQSVGVVA
ncbi:MAG: methylmalonyl Co-A mutase-associated GTPase MeaB, partial [Candidatus Neomarinimicrobiota bacterium]|nr:methylmalonyl Co-A mutase-associated GTPase MeaB [Candidatus Neomarinimicrobiota bacterium]